MTLVSTRKSIKHSWKLNDNWIAGFIEPGQFCMGVVRTHPMECGTIACIGGWVGINLNLGVQATHRMVASASGSIRKLYFPDEIRSYHV